MVREQVMTRATRPLRTSKSLAIYVMSLCGSMMFLLLEPCYACLAKSLRLLIQSEAYSQGTTGFQRASDPRCSMPIPDTIFGFSPERPPSVALLDAVLHFLASQTYL